MPKIKTAMTHINPIDGGTLYRLGFSWYRTERIYAKGSSYKWTGMRYYMTESASEEQARLLPDNAEHIGSHVILWTKTHMRERVTSALRAALMTEPVTVADDTDADAEE